MSEFEQKMQTAVFQYLENKDAIAHLKDEQQNLLDHMSALLRKENQATYTFLMDSDNLVVVTDDMSNRRVLNKEDLANDLGMKKSQLKTPVLLGCVESGRLTRAKYERYHYNDVRPKTTVKKRKPKKGRKK